MGRGAGGGGNRKEEEDREKGKREGRVLGFEVIYTLPKKSFELKVATTNILFHN